MGDFLSQSQSAPLRVLVVDDERDTVKSMAILVRMWGHEVYTAYDADEAMAVARAFPPDVVFLDIGLPKTDDGFELAEKLLELDQGGDMRIVAISGYTELDKRTHAKAVGIHEYLLKPVDPVRLETMLTLRSEVLRKQVLA
jgi:CheY-like chemotaxis protein